VAAAGRGSGREFFLKVLFQRKPKEKMQRLHSSFFSFAKFVSNPSYSFLRSPTSSSYFSTSTSCNLWSSSPLFSQEDDSETDSQKKRKQSEKIRDVMNKLRKEGRTPDKNTMQNRLDDVFKWQLKKTKDDKDEKKD